MPTKSKPRYEKAYTSFKIWCSENHVKNIGCESVYMAYFSELAKNKKSSTMWSLYSMLRATLSIKDKVDITKFGKLSAFLKKQNVGYIAKKSCTFTRQEICSFLPDAPDDFLPVKVFYFVLKHKIIKN